MAVAVVLFPGCGKSTVSSPSATPPALASTADGQNLMKGYAAFGSQCSSGFNTDPKAVKLELWSCPFKVPVVELTEPIQPLYLNADCARKVLTIRSYDRSINVNWELMPDGSFYLTQGGLSAKIKDDGNGNQGCSVPLSMDLWGHVDCSPNSRNQAKIYIESVMWLSGKSPSTPSPSVSPTPFSPPPPISGAQCSVPSEKCYFHAISTVTQCI